MHQEERRRWQGMGMGAHIQRRNLIDRYGVKEYSKIIKELQ